jgi:molybdopterin converting factor small subunit
MSVSVLLFASYADAFGARRLELPVEAPCPVSRVVEAMRVLPGGDRLPAQPLVAVNRTWAGADAMIRAGDEVAVIPPVAGG